MQPVLFIFPQVSRKPPGGWGISRETLAKIESQIRWVADAELLCLAESLKVPLENLLPKRPAKAAMQGFFRGLGKD